MCTAICQLAKKGGWGEEFFQQFKNGKISALGRNMRTFKLVVSHFMLWPLLIISLVCLM